MKKCTKCGKEFESEKPDQVLCQECLDKETEEERREREESLAHKEGYLTRKEVEEGTVEVKRIDYVLKRERSKQDELKKRIGILEGEKEDKKRADMEEVDRVKAEKVDLEVKIDGLQQKKLDLEHQNLVNSVLMKTKHKLKGLYLEKVGGKDEQEIVENIRRLEGEQEEFVKEFTPGGEGEEESPEDVNPPLKKKGKGKNLGAEKAKEQFKDHKQRDSGYEG